MTIRSNTNIYNFGKNLLWIFLLSIVVSTNGLQAQSDTTANHHHSVYIEILGIGGYGSINYERSIYHHPMLDIGYRLGLGGYKLNDFTDKFNPDLTIPIGIYMTYGKDHKIEFGIGNTVSSIVKADASNWQPRRYNEFHGSLAIGYRYQKENGRIAYQISYTPLFENYRTSRNWARIAIGYLF